MVTPYFSNGTTTVMYEGTPVDDIGVAGDPADVGGAPVDVGVAQIEDPLGGRVDPGQVPAGGVHDALGLAGGARGVEQVQHVLGVHLLGRAVGGGILDEVVPPDIAAALHVDLLAAPL